MWSLRPAQVLRSGAANGPQVLLRSIENAFKLSFQAEPTARQELERQLSKAVAPEQALALENLSGAAKALLSEIVKDDRSDTKGASFMLISETLGYYVPYLWDNHVHGALQFPMIDIATQRMAADELATPDLCSVVVGPRDEGGSNASPSAPIRPHGDTVSFWLRATPRCILL
jgi:hypothetical protein